MSASSLASRTRWRSRIIATVIAAVLPTLVACAQTATFTSLYSFSGPVTGTYPSCTLVQGSDGNFYGTTQRGGPGLAGTVFRVTAAGVLTTLYSFDGLTQGGSPAAALVQGTDGNFYGTTQQGGANSFGTVFKMTPAGTLTTLYNFSGANDGVLPNSLVQGTDGNLYGTTQQGGANSIGTVFKMTPAGTLTTLYSFGGTNGGSNPAAALAQGSDGNFYGTTQQGGTNGFGTVFKITPAGALTSLYSFAGGTDASNSSTALVQGANGNFYGTTQQNGTYQAGTVFQITPAGVLTTLYSFTGTTDGLLPNTLVRGSGGNLYGTTLQGGANGLGTMFQITPAGVLTTLYSFAGTTDGLMPNTFISGSDGLFHGTTQQGGSNGFGTVFQITPAGALTTLYNFGGNSGGNKPAAALVQQTNGNFLGTTQQGGANGLGTVFQMTPAGVLTTLYSFAGTKDGSSPAAALLQGADGNFYGTTQQGGANQSGTVFRMTPAGVLTTLYSFAGAADGGNPAAALVQGTNGTFYGTTQQGGVSGFGTVFQMTSAGVVTTLYNFGGATGGFLPNAVTLGSDGSLYGTTQQGGANGFGTVFHLTTAGALTTLYAFAGTSDGFSPNALVRGSDGNFYGTTQYSNGINGFGTAFKITTAGTLTTLYTFAGAADGTSPTAALLQGADGNFYGTTRQAGANGLGTVFQLTPAGGLTTLYSFIGTPDGARPAAPLVRATDGGFYSTTTTGGASNLGLIFRLVVVGKPNAANAAVNVGFNTATSVTLSGTDTTSPAQTLGYAIATNPSHGTLGTLNTSTGVVVYTPTGGYHGTDSFTFTASNSANTSNPATVTLTVATGTPTAMAQSVSAPIHAATSITLAGSDPDIPALALTYTVATQPGHGTLSGTAPNLTYTSTSGYRGSDSFTFTVTNGSKVSSPATISLTVAAGTPTANPQSVNVPYSGSGTAITLTGTDPDSPALALTYALPGGTTTAHGKLSGLNASTGAVTYIPTSGYHGSDTFTFTVSNGTNTSVAATVTLTVATGTPVANAQSANVAHDTARTITLNATDTETPVTTLTYAIGTGPTHGTLSNLNTGTGAVTYMPAAGYHGNDSFTFTASNGTNTSAAAAVTLTVATGTPAATPQSLSTAVNTAVTITLNSTDNDSPALTRTYNAASPGHGTLSGTAPNLTYTPAANYVGSDSFTFTASNGTNTSAAATVSINVTGTAPAITSVNTKVFTIGSTNTFTVVATGLPVPTLSESGALPPGVTFTDNGNGAATLGGTPGAGSSSSYALTLTAHNAVSPDATQTFTLVINHPPVAGVAMLSATQNTAASFPAANLLSSASDPDGDLLSITSVGAGSTQGGTVTLSAQGSTGTITYTPASNFTGTDTFSYVLSDGRGGVATGIATVAVTNNPALNVVSMTKTASAVTIVYAGIPGSTYQPQYVVTLDGGAWTNDGPVMTADGNGRFSYTDTTQPQPPSRFYRAVATTP